MINDWVISLEECLPDFDIHLERCAIIELAKVMQANASLIADIEYEMRGGRATKQEPDYKTLYERTRSELMEMKRENDIFRASVATRRNVALSSVHTEAQRR